MDADDLSTCKAAREAASAALKELALLRSRGSMTQEAFDAEIQHIAHEKVQPCGCDLLVRHTADGTRILIKVQQTGKVCDLIECFFHHHTE